jgi:hypothetical protein
MKKLANLFFIWIIVAGCGSVPLAIHNPYPEQINVQTNTIHIQNSFGPGEIEAKEYLFPYIVKRIDVDSTEMKALVQLRKPEEKASKVPAIIVYYDLLNDNVIWTIRSNGWNPIRFNDKIILETYKETLAINKTNGNLIWERAGRHGLMYTEKGIAVSGLITTYDLNTGKDIWHRDVKSQFGADEIKLDGESIIASIDGLHAYNIKNGDGWDIEMSTGKKDEIATAAKNVGLVLLSATTIALGGGAVTSYAKTNQFSGMTSNILICDNHIFFAAKDNLICVDKDTGNEKWRTSLPIKKSAKSILLENGGHIFFVNKSYCYKNKEFYRYGKPYIAKFDKISGEQLFFDILDIKDHVTDVQITPNGYYLVTKDELVNYAQDGSLTAKLDLSDQNTQYGNIYKFIDNNFPISRYFVHEDDKFLPLWQYVSESKHPVVNTENGLLVLGSELDIIKWIPKDKIYYETVQGTPNNILRCTKFYSLRNELAILDWKIKLRTASLPQMKKYKKRYTLIETEYRDILRDVYMVDNNANAQAKFEIPGIIKSTDDNFYFTTAKGLNLISKHAIIE